MGARKINKQELIRQEYLMRQMIEQRCRDVDAMYLNMFKDEKPLAGVRMYMLSEFLAKDLVDLAKMICVK
jgi:hypothetical protein